MVAGEKQLEVLFGKFPVWESQQHFLHATMPRRKTFQNVLDLTVENRTFVAMIYDWASPADILALRRVCSAFADEFTTDMLVQSRLNLARLPGPPSVTAQPQWGEGEVAYAKFLFGFSPCLVCAKLCSGLPVCYALAFRCCSAGCKDKIDAGYEVETLVHWTALHAWYAHSYDELRFRQWLPPSHREGNHVLTSTKNYNYAELEQAHTGIVYFVNKEGQIFPDRTPTELWQENERRKASWKTILKNHLALVAWQHRAEQDPIWVYDNSGNTEIGFQLPAREILRLRVIVEVNHERLATFAASLKVEVDDVCRTPTVAHLVRCFNRDRTPFHMMALHAIAPQVALELDILALERRSHATAEPTMVCTDCRTLLDVRVFEDHCRQRHPKRTEVWCPECPEAEPEELRVADLLHHFRIHHPRK
ncbi:hypothetical protein B0H16DRAFT_1002653 [Mycena metata]|uniref:Uncharacterized protein n=1 Tax=Mycena metata TaxID=1033252 RepID=A0AAD7K5H4_9AGAR|nr:hypothetical protein B0H16DRAFT_412579 [Mycena metata]KAJ7776172.1 hypothetical protein B0H16DRAFT_1002653 [Mycena metata]